MPDASVACQPEGCNTAGAASTAACGDGLTERGEECDDGDVLDGDGCSRFCRVEGLCGDGTLQRGEGCDDGNLEFGDGCNERCLQETDAGLDAGVSGAGGVGGTGGSAGMSFAGTASAGGSGGGVSVGGASGASSMAGSGAVAADPVCLPLPLPAGVDPLCRCLDGAIDLDANTLEDCAQTIVQNSQFTIGIDGWGTQGGVETQWDARNLGLKSTSGSLRVALTLIEPASSQRAVSGAWQCVPVAPDQDYLLFANYFIDTDQPASTSASINGFHHASSDCTGTFVSVWQSPSGDERGRWGEITGTFKTPPGVNSLRLRLSTSKVFFEASTSTLWDNILLAPSGLCGNGQLDARESCDPPNGSTCDGVCRVLDPCLSCQQTHCAPSAAACFDSADVAVGGVRRSELCRSAFDCIRQSECDAAGVEACYCGVAADGSLDPMTTAACLAGMPGGTCRMPIEEAAESSEPSTIALRFFDDSLALGRSIELVSCSRVWCAAECAPPAICGNGGPEAGDEEYGEQCDDGNTLAGDGCGPSCQLECGNGTLDPGEQCDDGNRSPADGCDELCFPEVPCGDGLTEGREECDDGNQENCDGCAYPSCTMERCGNARRDCNEDCDDPDHPETCFECRTVVCGGASPDGLVKVEGIEECDDGNRLECDGCSGHCTSERCGNGRVECSEDCEPPGTALCDANCQDIQTGTCAQCEAEFCPTRVADCAAHGAACQAVVDCARQTGCADPPNLIETCYCGSGVSTAQCLAGTVSGECRTVIETGAGTNDPATVTELYVDPAVPTGAAMRLINCDRQFCGSVCFAD